MLWSAPLRQRLRLVASALAVMLLPLATAGAATLEVLHSFAGRANGATPLGGVAMDADGALYGTTFEGGRHGAGTVFRLSDSGHQVLHHFASGADGEGPQGDLIISRSGAVYGTTFRGGPGQVGTLFRVAPAGGYQQLAVFDGPGNGPASGVAEGPEGALYGTTMYGGAAPCRCGTIYRYDPATASKTMLHAFDGAGGANPAATPTIVGNRLIGTASYGGSKPRPGRGSGVLYAMALDGSAYGSRIPDTGNYPLAGLTPDGLGRAWGAMHGGGAEGGGGVFRTDAQHDYAWVHGFIGGLNAGGAYPAGTLLRARDGMLYGTTTVGGAYPCFCGMVYRIDPATSAFEIVWGFTGKDGVWPTGALAQDAQGRLYGVTKDGGASGNGVIFRLTL